MLPLKTYQQGALDALTAYLRQADALHRAGLPEPAAIAFQTQTAETLGRPVPYNDIGRAGRLDDLRGLPYVCLRLPTGGGKTLLACHALAAALREWVQTDRGAVLWLVPSETIRAQTLAALRDPRHPYRQALTLALGGPVRVADLGEALYLGRSAYEEATVVVVATMQAFRVSAKEGRKVYDEAGALLDHFEGRPPEALAGMDTYDDGTVKRSFANVLRLYRPVVVVDEAHNARTGLSFETVARFKPACIVELTATPDTGREGSNVLYAVSAAQLKAEGMIKLPLVLTTHPAWTDTLDAALGRRAQLERDAEAEAAGGGTYVRPILLVQAQPRSQGRETVTVDAVERYLAEHHRLPADWVAVATGERRELDGVDLLAPSCGVRVVVTVQALGEGWDCPFAYVLAALGNITAETAVEQLVGRVLRMPYAERRATPSLNEAYVYAASSRFAETLTGLQDALVKSGFERVEAAALIRAADAREAPAPGAAPLFEGLGGVVIPVPADPGLGALPEAVRAKVSYDAATRTLTVHAPLSASERSALVQHVSAPAREAVRGAFAAYATPSPAERGEPFVVPVLALRQGELFEALTPSHFLDHAWRLNDFEATLPAFALPDFAGVTGRLDVDADRQRVMATRVDPAAFADDLRRQTLLLAQEGGWTEDELVRWLDRETPAHDIVQADKRAFLGRLVRHLDGERGMPVASLVRVRHPLRRAVQDRIAEHRREAARRGTQQFLFDPPAGAEVVASAERVFTFPPDAYPYHRLYRGAVEFQRHYYREVGDMNDEEEAVAIDLDGLADVKTWVRNAERDAVRAFSLPTSSDRFYPDFVALLHGGQVLVVEHKSSRDWTNADTVEKRAVGEVWEKASGGRLAFSMTRDSDRSAIGQALGRLRP